MAEINWTRESLRWLEDIYGYIAGDNPAAAERTIDGIYRRAQDLIAHPLIGYRYTGSNRHVRILLYEKYRITYLVKDSGDIDILGVFHGALDISNYQL